MADIYIAPEPNDNSTYEDATLYVAQRKRIRLNAFGLYLQTTDGKFVSEDDFELSDVVQQAIVNETKMCFVIKHVDRPDNDEIIQPADEYVNVGKNLQLIKSMHPNLTGAIDRMIANDYPGESPMDRMSRIEGLDGVLAAKNDAIEEAWYEPVD